MSDNGKINHKVFYGEYSLKHWIDLILKGKIEIPEFQRYFVWEEEDVHKLIKSLEDNSFIPPIMIGAYSEKCEAKDYIIDGQQRLSSILLAWLNKYPNKENNKPKDNYNLSDSNDDDSNDDDSNDDDEEREEINLCEWNFEKIRDLSEKDKGKILDKMNDQGYSNLYDKETLDEKFFEEHYLGFSYIKLESKDEKEQMKFYSKLFRNINSNGKNLSMLETRKALYWLDKEKEKLFNPSWAKEIKINGGILDFARLLAFVSAYSKEKKGKKKYISFGGYYKGQKVQKLESFIVSYITEEKPPQNCYKKLEKLEEYINSLGIKKEYSSIIDTDMYMFGLVYYVLFEGKELDLDKEKLQKEIFKKIDKIKANENHKKKPAALKWVKERIYGSVEIYKNISKENKDEQVF